MRKNNIKLEWYVLEHDFNSKSIKNSNILEYLDIEDLHKSVVKKKEIKNIEELKDYLRGEMFYYLHSRAEHEIMVGGLFSKEEEYEKIDAFRQIEMNLDQMTEYVNKKLEIFN